MQSSFDNKKYLFAIRHVSIKHGMKNSIRKQIRKSDTDADLTSQGKMSNDMMRRL